MASKEYYIDEYLSLWLKRASTATNKDWVHLHQSALGSAASFCSERKNMGLHYSALMDMHNDAAARGWALRWWKFWKKDVIPQADLWIYVLSDILYGSPSGKFREEVDGFYVKHLEMVLWEMTKAGWENKNGLGEHTEEWYESDKQDGSQISYPAIKDYMNIDEPSEFDNTWYPKPRGVAFFASETLRNGRYCVVFVFSGNTSSNEDGILLCTHPMQRPMTEDNKAGWALRPQNTHTNDTDNAILAKDKSEASSLTSKIAEILNISDLGECHVLPSMTKQDAVRSVTWRNTLTKDYRYLVAEINGKPSRYILDVKHLGVQLIGKSDGRQYQMSLHNSTLDECYGKIAREENSRLNRELGLNFHWVTRSISTSTYNGWIAETDDVLVFAYSENMLAAQVEEESREKPKKSEKYDLAGWRIDWSVYSPLREACLPTLVEDENSVAEGLLHTVSSFQYALMQEHNALYGYVPLTIEADVEGEKKNISFFAKEKTEPVPEQHKDIIASDVAEKMLEAAEDLSFSDEYLAHLLKSQF